MKRFDRMPADLSKRPGGRFQAVADTGASAESEQKAHDFVFDFLPLCPSAAGVSTGCWARSTRQDVAAAMQGKIEKKPCIVNHLDASLHVVLHAAMRCGI